MTNLASFPSVSPSSCSITLSSVRNRGNLHFLFFLFHLHCLSLPSGRIPSLAFMNAELVPVKNDFHFRLFYFLSIYLFFFLHLCHLLCSDQFELFSATLTGDHFVLERRFLFRLFRLTSSSGLYPFFLCTYIYIFFFLYQKSTAFIKDDSLGSLGSLPLLSPFHLPLNCNFIYLSFDATSTLLSLNLMPGMKLPPDHADMQISFVFRETGRGLAMQMSYLFREILAITRNAINSSKLIPPPHPTNPSF